MSFHERLAPQPRSSVIRSGSVHNYRRNLPKRAAFGSTARLSFLTQSLLDVARKHNWALQAWAVFPNHYHFVAISSPASGNLKKLIQNLHSTTAIQANRWDNTPKRRVWFEYWESFLTFPESYYARLNYVHNNAVHHGLVQEATNYPWCSAGWFKLQAKPSFCKRIMEMKSDRVAVSDDYSVSTKSTRS
ncbi:MAG: transposase [Acidobacteria bacterium]|nr:transposase [Acidobacteriota bacterium]